MMRSPSSLPAMQVTMPSCPVLPSNTCLHLPVLGAHNLHGQKEGMKVWKKDIKVSERKEGRYGRKG